MENGQGHVKKHPPIPLPVMDKILQVFETDPHNCVVSQMRLLFILGGQLGMRGVGEPYKASRRFFKLGQMAGPAPMKTLTFERDQFYTKNYPANYNRPDLPPVQLRDQQKI